MNAYDQIYKAYNDAQINGFWDAWGIVASPKTIYELREVCQEERMSLQLDPKQGVIEKTFGLVVIPHKDGENDKVYIVDEQLGKIILGLNERNERW